jgi:4-diphosphocytidyl-2-C-methyl-D-erythritol kinase
VVPLDAALSTPDVYRAFDAGSRPRGGDELGALDDELAGGALAPERVVNDLQDAARSLCPAIDPALDAVRAGGARHALVAGSGPTVFGVFDEPEAAEAAAAALASRYPRAVAAVPVAAADAAPVPA